MNSFIAPWGAKYFVKVVGIAPALNYIGLIITVN
jgi:hypothetical protein